MRSVPKPSAGHGLSAATQSVAECVKLGLVLLELQAFAVDHVGCRVRDEPLVCEHLLRTLDLLREPRALALDVTLAVAGRPHNRFEDPLRVAADLDADAATAVDARRRLRLVERVELGFEV